MESVHVLQEELDEDEAARVAGVDKVRIALQLVVVV